MWGQNGRMVMALALQVNVQVLFTAMQIKEELKFTLQGAVTVLPSYLLTHHFALMNM